MIFKKKRMNIDKVTNSKIMNEIKVKCFIFEKDRVGTAYHEFQMGNKKNLFWDKDSILLKEELMEETKPGNFFNKYIPNYNYFGPSIVTKDTWCKLLAESKNESWIIENLIIELTPWVKNCFLEYDCFTILGI